MFKIWSNRVSTSTPTAPGGRQNYYEVGCSDNGPIDMFYSCIHRVKNILWMYESLNICIVILFNKVRKTPQITTAASITPQWCNRTILNANSTVTLSPSTSCFTLGGSRHDSSSWSVRVQVSGKKLVKSTTEMILWSMILIFMSTSNQFVEKKILIFVSL